MVMLLLLSTPLAGAIFLGITGDRRWAPDANILFSAVTLIAAAWLVTYRVADNPVLFLSQQFSSTPSTCS